MHVHKMKGGREIGGFDGKLDVSARGHSTLADNVDTDTVIEVCWNHRSYGRSWHTFEPKWNDLYVFIDHPSFVGADRPFVTGTGGHDDRDLLATGRGC